MTEDQNNFNKAEEGDQLEIVYYTDPLCCWSWAFEPQWRRLRYELKGFVKWRYCMGGLIPSWTAYSDPMNSISRPAQMGPLWMEASHISGMPIDTALWIQDSPGSSYPACIAYRCAELQSPQAGELYLRYLREAAMTRRLNIAKTEILVALANELSSASPQVFNFEAFKSALDSPLVKTKFTEDLKEVRFHQIGRFPTFIIKNPANSKAVIIVGYRPYKVLLEAVSTIAPNLIAPGKIEVEEYKRYWGRLTERELREVKEAAFSFT